MFSKKNLSKVQSNRNLGCISLCVKEEEGEELIFVVRINPVEKQ